MAGDGCEVCNPAQALEYAKETIADLTAENANLKAAMRGKTFYCSDEAAMQELGTLRSEKPLIAAQMLALDQERERVEGVNAKLREALEKIAADPSQFALTPTPLYMRHIARAALKA